MSDTAFDAPNLAAAIENSFKRPVTSGRLIWCPSVMSSNVYYCAQQQPTGNLEELRRRGEKAIEEQRWKIALYKVEFGQREGHLYPSSCQHLSDLSAPVKITLDGTVHIQSRKVFSYNHMMELMTGFYNPSSSDPMKPLPGHISDEITVWKRKRAVSLQRTIADIEEQRRQLG